MSINLPIKVNLDENKIKYGVFRLDIYHKPGWFLMQTYENERDADIYCDMMNLDTNIIHRVFIFEDDNEVQ
jgi:hypothetical protein